MLVYTHSVGEFYYNTTINQANLWLRKSINFLTGICLTFSSLKSPKINRPQEQYVQEYVIKLRGRYHRLRKSIYLKCLVSDKLTKHFVILLEGEHKHGHKMNYRDLLEVVNGIK